MDATPPATPPFRLITLGRIALETPDGEDADLARRRRKLALLAVLALSPEPHTRSELTRMFWADEDDDRARHSLSDALSHLRRVLGRDAITGRSEVVQLQARGRLIVDATELEDAAAIGDHERVQALYGGRFLNTVVVEGSSDFDRWVSPRRDHYAALRAAATGPSPVRSLASHPSATAARRRSRSVLFGALAVAAVSITIAFVAVRRGSAHSASAPVVALTDVWTDPADSSLAWLDEGLKQMIAADLERVATAGVIAPAVVRDAAPFAHPDSLSSDASISLARQLHADWAASGSVSRRSDAYVVTITLRDVSHETLTKQYTVSGKDILAVADQATAKMLSALDADEPGPHLSDIETANTDAYRHFIRSEALHSEGKFADEVRELDAAIAADSGFTSAIVARMLLANGLEARQFQPLFDRARPRMTEWDRLTVETFQADRTGEHQRAELLARQLVARYPRDPRSLRAMAELYAQHGAYQAAETAYVRLIALDSAAPPNGTCWACEGYAGLSGVRQVRGDSAGAIGAARQWTVLRPASAAAWLDLANTLELNGDIPPAEAAYARYRLLTGEELFDPFTGRMLLMARRYDEAEQYARRYLHSVSSDDAYDLLQTTLRERGQFHDALKVFDAWHASRLGAAVDLVYASTLGALGDDAQARAVFEHAWSSPPVDASASTYGVNARGFAWGHALEVDAFWTRADTSMLHAVADSVERIGGWSSYARDWTLFHHIRGLIAERAGRWREAQTEFQQALSLVPGWTRSNVELAKVDVALGSPDQAIEALRLAYHQPLDAMGRYVPRSELDFQMALAFDRANHADSARVYASYVRTAWAHADPEFARRLLSLP